MDPYLKVLGDKRVHPVVDHQHRAVGRIEHGQVEHGPQKVMVLTESLRPRFKLARPFFLVFVESIFSFEDELELVIAVILIAEYARKINIELMQVPEVSVIVLLDLCRHGIHHPEGVATQEVFNLDKVNQIMQQ